jgi:hypothetical protein
MIAYLFISICIYITLYAYIYVCIFIFTCTYSGFPEAKVLKQLVRDVIDPNLSLGHSDRKSKVIEFTEEQ